MCKKIFLSWSSSESNRMGKVLKTFLDKVFNNGNEKRVEIFISDENVYSGENWFNKLLNELKTSDLAIICLTPNNLKSEWMNFESGGIAANSSNTKIIPFLLNPMELEKRNPLSHYQKVNSSNKSQITGLVKTINESLENKKIDFSSELFKSYLNQQYNLFRPKIKRIEKQYEQATTFTIYPEKIRKIVPEKVFVGAPMASTESDDAFKVLREDMLSIVNALKRYCSFDEIYYPGQEIDNKEKFDGKELAIEMDFKELKSSEYYVFVYPKKLPSSVLMEIGYAIALSKKTIIFTTDRKELPFMLQECDKAISNVKIYLVPDTQEIIRRIEKNGKTLFTTF